MGPKVRRQRYDHLRRRASGRAPRAAARPKEARDDLRASRVTGTTHGESPEASRGHLDPVAEPWRPEAISF